jgi:2-(1,2-epoxy-1,2-dihydrophenyl)acetyl-CoA isomerase
MMNYKTLNFSAEGAFAKVALNRPEALNAISVEMAEELTKVFEELKFQDQIRAVILTGAGRAFCSGGDVKQMLTVVDKDPASYFGAPLEIYHRLILSIRELPKPVIAAINGLATGAGFNLALACDVRIASDNAKMSQAFIRIGLVPDFGGTFFLPRIVGLTKAMELMMTGELIDAEQAKQLNIVNLVVKESELEASANFFAAEAAQLPTSAIGRLKRLMNASFSSSLEEQLKLEAEMQIESAGTEDFAEGVRAFSQKRMPKFKGR